MKLIEFETVKKFEGRMFDGPTLGEREVAECGISSTGADLGNSIEKLKSGKGGLVYRLCRELEGTASSGNVWE